MGKAFIDNLFNEKAKNDSNSEDLANTLNILAKTVFGDINRFIFELLQNADDSPSTQDKPLNVSFHLFDNYLLFYHNGKHFEEVDVKGISRVGSLDSQKDKNIEKTGYKGIGFKSVFRTSDCVQIISDKYRFKFDKNYHLWANDKSYPWQVIPIWEKNIPDEVINYIDYENVNTIIEINNRDGIHSEIMEVFQDCQIILFLRNVASISFIDKNEEQFIITKSKKGTDTYELLYNNELRSKWYIKDFYVEITDELKGKLRTLSDEECPRKLKEANGTKLTFASYISPEEKLFPLDNTIVYNYLPTKVEFDFPFIVNGDFITNAERTQLLVNDWNKFLLYTIAKLQFNLLVDINSTSFKYDILQILTTHISSTNKFYNSFKEGLDEAVKQIPFIPDTAGTKLLKVEDSLIDSLEYSRYFPAEHIINLFGGNYSVINPNLLSKKKIKKIGAQDFDEENYHLLLESVFFKSHSKTNRKYNIDIIAFLSQKIPQGNIYLKKYEFIIDNSGNLKAPENLYFPTNNISDKISFAELAFINNEVYIEISRNKDIVEWLISLDVKYPKEIEILRKSVFKIISENCINKENSIIITRFIFKLYKAGELTDNDYTSLKKIVLLTNNGIQKSEDCYLPDRYNPSLKLEKLVPGQNYVIEDYIDNQSDLNLWKSFFIKLHVKESIKVVVYGQTERTKLISINNDFQAYLNWIDSNDFYDKIYYPYRNSGQHAVSNLKYIYFLDNLIHSNFAKLFWDILISDWNGYIVNSGQTLYHHRYGNEQIPDYLYFYVRNFDSIPAIDGKCYKSVEVYSPRFKSIIGDKFPVADFKSSLLTKEQISYLGLKEHIEIDNCIQLLNFLSCENVHNDNKKQIFDIYEEIIKSYKEGNRIKNISNIKLLALNNEFIPISHLYYFNINSLTPPINSEHFLQIPENLKEKDKSLFCEIFNIPVINYKDLEFTPEGIEKDVSLKQKLEQIIPFLSVIFSHNKSIPFDSVFLKLSTLLSNTVIYKAKTLNLQYKNIDGELIYDSIILTWHDDSNFFYSGKWDSPLNIYSLSSLLCTYFELDNIDKELSLFLQISKGEIEEWLIDKGYKLPLIEDTTYIAGEEIQNNIEVAEPTIDTEEITDFISIEEFIPEVEATEADIINVKVNNATSETINYKNLSQFQNIQNDEVKIDIGRWSEEYIYNYLKSLNKYSSITWMNEETEAYQPYDFIIVEDGVEKYIEVKGTPSNSKNEFYISKNEWIFMFENKSNYFIYRLFNAGKKDNLEIKIIDEPHTRIPQGELLPDTINLYV